MSDLKFEGFVLAGGKSSRMGADKAFLEIGGETFLERAVKILSDAGGSPVKIVLNRRQTHFIEKLPAGVPYVFDIYENRGALSGIHTAFKSCASRRAFVLACDMPSVTARAIENLVKAASKSPEKFAVVPKQSNGKIQPLCALYEVEKCLPVLEEFFVSDAGGAVKNFLKLVPTLFIEEHLLGENKNLFLNINRPSDYQKIKSSNETNSFEDF